MTSSQTRDVRKRRTLSQVLRHKRLRWLPNLVATGEICLKFRMPKVKIAEFANCVDPDEVAHYEPPHLDLYRLLTSP